MYGFGSFFRGEPFNDVDILAVASVGNSEVLRTYYKVSTALRSIRSELTRPCHLTLMTHEEFASRPMRHMNELQCLWSAPNETS